MINIYMEASIGNSSGAGDHLREVILEFLSHEEMRLSPFISVKHLKSRTDNKGIYVWTHPRNSEVISIPSSNF